MKYRLRKSSITSGLSLGHALRIILLLFTSGSVFLSVVSAAERKLRINLGTLAPRGSIYHQALQSMGEEWRKVSMGNVRLVVYPDGTQGGEADMVRLMRIGTLHAGLLTAVGLSDIEPSVSGLQTMPMMYRTLEEFEHVTAALRPRLEARFAEKGFVVLYWVDAGWVRYFSKQPMLLPEDLKRMKLFVWAGSVEQVDMLKSSGFNPVPLETGEILGGLQTGLISAVTAPPIFALAGQIDLRAPHMLELNWAPLVGAAVIKKELWDSIPEAQRASLLKAAEDTGMDIRANSRTENLEAVAAMRKRGLTVYSVTPEMENSWREAATAFYPKIRGSLVPADMFDEVKRLLEDYRSKGDSSRP